MKELAPKLKKFLEEILADPDRRACLFSLLEDEGYLEKTVGQEATERDQITWAKGGKKA